MQFGLFQYVAILAWVPFLPSGFWNGLAAKWGYLSGRLGAGPAFDGHAGCNQVSAGSVVGMGWIPNLLAGVMLLYVALWNVRALDFNYWEPRILPAAWNALGNVTRMNQKWSMFAPNPSKADGWYVFRGVLHNGDVVNLWEPGTPLTLDRPVLLSGQYPNHRWRKFASQLRNPRNRELRRYFGVWLRRSYENTVGVHDPGGKVRTVEIIYMLERTPPPGMDPRPPKAVRVWRGTFR